MPLHTVPMVRVAAVPLVLLACIASTAQAGRAAAGEAAAAVVQFEALARGARDTGRLVIQRVSLADRQTVDLDLRPFTVADGARFVVGRLGPDGLARDQEYAFDTSRVLLLRGKVAGRPGSHVFLAISEWGARGTVDLGTGDPAAQFHLIAGAGEAGALRLAAVPRSAATGALGVPLCGVGPHAAPAGAAGAGRADPPPAGGSGPVRGLRQLELAVETDYEYYEQLGGDLDRAAAYIVVLYGAVSDIYMRDVNVRVDLSFVRLWETPDDLFNAPDPLVEFREYWNANMKGVQRDAAQFCTGRRDLWAGGVAYLKALCNSSSYSWAGYIVGFVETLAGPVPFDHDVMVTAHELGHNAGALHNHDYGLDTCHKPESKPRRGGIMSYCGQTYSGGAANHDLRFETVVQEAIRGYTYGRPCIARDCNGNGVEDADDIQSGFSLDLNGNGEPDECEDCNGNGVLDSIDIAAGFSLDLNGNGVPDDCEPDCNGNGIPDDLDIAEGTSADTYMNGVPDECELDCDGDGVIDYNQIQADMTLDIDRDAVLDACQDCDGNGISDLIELRNSRAVFVTSVTDPSVRRFYATTGVLNGVSDAAVGLGADLVISPAGRVFVSSFTDDRVAEFDADGSHAGDLVPAGYGGLSGPTGLLLRPDGRLLVSSAGTDSVLQYDTKSGAFLGALVATGEGGLSGPFGLAFSAAGTLLVTGDDDSVREYDAGTGEFLRIFIPPGASGLSTPRGMARLPGGNILVASYDNRSLLEYDGFSGAFVRKFNRGGTVDRLSLDEPWGVRVGPDGDVYASTSHVHDGGDGVEELHLTKARIFHFNVKTGNLIRAFVQGDDTGLWRPTGFDFMPASPLDCNGNQVIDACDIAGGLSLDLNGDGVPDECGCYPDIDGNGTLNLFDFLAFVNLFNAGDDAADCDGSGTLSLFDFLCFVNEFNAGC